MTHPPYNAPWSPEEEAALRQHYPLGGTDACQRHIQRTVIAIRKRAKKLHIRFSGSREVISIDPDKAIDLYRQLGTVEKVADAMGVSEYVIIRAMNKQGFKRGNWHAIDRHREAVIADYTAAQLPMNDLATKYGTSRSELKRALKRWNVPRIKRAHLLHTNGVLKPNRKPVYQCWVETYGREEADNRMETWRAKKRQNSEGTNNPMYGKPTPQGSGNGWKGWYRGHYFRSLREATYMLDLDYQGISWTSGESMCIPYEWNGRQRTYRPDFIVDNTVLVEIKPLKLHATPTVQAKETAAQAFCHTKGLEYRVVDVRINAEAIYDAYIKGLIRFDRDYEKRFLTYVAKDY